jgi:hypothetical protein
MQYSPHRNQAWNYISMLSALEQHVLDIFHPWLALFPLSGRGIFMHYSARKQVLDET